MFTSESGRKAGRIGGRRRIQLHGNPSTPEGSVLGGRIAGSMRTPAQREQVEQLGRTTGPALGRKYGRKNVETGHIFTIATTESRQAGGRIMGRKHAESGQMDKIRTPETCAAGGRAGCHSRWHAARGVRNPKCELCLKEMAVPAEEKI